jgi:hypothetical protein
MGSAVFAHCDQMSHRHRLSKCHQNFLLPLFLPDAPEVADLRLGGPVDL